MKILVLDIETSPIIAHVWGLWDNNVSLNQIVADWHVLSWSAKWLGAKEVFYDDQRNEKNIADDKRLLKGIWKLLDEADIIIAQNGRKFDVKKLNARFILNGMKPPSSYKIIDTLEIARRRFGFTSNKLEYMSDKLCTKYKKLKHKKFPGHEMWTECLKGNKKAWKAMEKYNKYDVLSLEELYTKLAPWDSTNLSAYTDDGKHVCSCGSTKATKNGIKRLDSGHFRRYLCECGKEYRGKENLLNKEQRKNLLVASK